MSLQERREEKVSYSVSGYADVRIKKEHFEKSLVDLHKYCFK